MSTIEDDRRAKATKAATKQLADGTWPQVITVYGYKNPRAPRVPDEDYARLKTLFERAGFPNLAAFTACVQMEEKVCDVTLSFNVSLCRRRTPEGASDTDRDLADFESTPDMLVGTRGGVEGAAVWLHKWSWTMAQVGSEVAQVVDKIFGEVVVALGRPPQTLTTAEMLAVALGEQDMPEPPEPIKQ